MDVERAFTQSKSIRRDVFVQPPKEAATDSKVLLQLRKAAYGLGEAAKEWYEIPSKTLKIVALQKSKNDPSLFFYKRDGKFKEIMSIQVDEF